MFVFFFFQAEDGIRDRTVTGVQTCALPIWFLRSIDDQMVEGAQKPKPTERYLENALNDFLDGKPIRRSEERRVGKEWRSRCAGEDYNKREKVCRSYMNEKVRHSSRQMMQVL